MGRKKQGVSPLLGTILLVCMVFVLGVGVSLIAGKVGGPNLKKIPNALLQIWRNFPGRGAVGVVNVTGDKIEEAFYADFVMDTEMGSLFRNLKWKNLEVRVNGQPVENELEYVLYASPLPQSLKVTGALLPFPSGGGMVSFSYRQGFLKEGDEVAVVHKPTGWVPASVTMTHPLQCTEIGGWWVGPNMVDSCIEMRALQLRALEKEMVGKLDPPSIELRYGENYRWYKEDFDGARSYIPLIENLAGEIQLLLNSCKANGGYLENDMRELYNYLGPELVTERDYYKLCMAYKSWDQARRGVPPDNRLLYILINGLEIIYELENPKLRAWDPSYVSQKWTKALMEDLKENVTKGKLLPLIRQIESILAQPPYPNVPVEAVTYFGISPEMDDVYEDFYRPALAPYLNFENIGGTYTRWVGDNFVWDVWVYNVGGENAENLIRNATLWYCEDNSPTCTAWWVSKYFKRAKWVPGTPASLENALYVNPDNWLVPMENVYSFKWGTRIYDNTYHNVYRYTERLRLDNWWKTRKAPLNTLTYPGGLSPELVAFNLQVPYRPENTNVKRFAFLSRQIDRINAGEVFRDVIVVSNIPASLENRIWFEEYWFVYKHPKTGQWETQYFWNVHWNGSRGVIPGTGDGGGGGGGGGGGC